MKYILINKSTASVMEIIPAENPIFPGISIKERYTPELISQLLPVEDNVEVEQNWIYDPSSGTFSPPNAPAESSSLSAE